MEIHESQYTCLADGMIYYILERKFSNYYLNVTKFSRGAPLPDPPQISYGTFSAFQSTILSELKNSNIFYINIDIFFG